MSKESEYCKSVKSGMKFSRPCGIVSITSSDSFSVSKTKKSSARYCNRTEQIKRTNELLKEISKIKYSR